MFRFFWFPCFCCSFHFPHWLHFFCVGTRATGRIDRSQTQCWCPRHYDFRRRFVLQCTSQVCLCAAFPVCGSPHAHVVSSFCCGCRFPSGDKLCVLLQMSMISLPQFSFFGACENISRTRRLYSNPVATNASVSLSDTIDACMSSPVMQFNLPALAFHAKSLAR